MQFTLVAFIFLTSLLSTVSAAPSSGGLDGIPSCATTCALNGITGTSCSMTDFKCICKDKKFLDTITSCVTTACSRPEQEQTLQVSQQLCKAAGVDFTATLPAATGTSTSATGVAGDGYVKAASATPTASGTAAASKNSAGRMGMSALGVIGLAGLAGALLV